MLRWCFPGVGIDMTKQIDPTEAVVRALATELKVPESVVLKARSLKTELRMDSIAAVNVAFALEDEYDIEIDIRQEDSFDSVEEIVAILRRVLDGR